MLPTSHWAFSPPWFVFGRAILNRPAPSLASIHEVTTISPLEFTPPQKPRAEAVSTPAAFRASISFPKGGSLKGTTIFSLLHMYDVSMPCLCTLPLYVKSMQGYTNLWRGVGLPAGALKQNCQFRFRSSATARKAGCIRDHAPPPHPFTRNPSTNNCSRNRAASSKRPSPSRWGPSTARTWTSKSA